MLLRKWDIYRKCEEEHKQSEEKKRIAIYCIRFWLYHT